MFFTSLLKSTIATKWQHYTMAGIAVISLVLLVSPLGMHIESHAGIDTLFALRGERLPPADVAIINIDANSIDQLGLSDKINQWDRRLHAQLIEQLQQLNARLIIFDIAFKGKSQELSDATLQNSLSNSNNVILIKDIMPVQYQQALIQNASRHIPPLPGFYQHAMVAGFILPTWSKQILGYTPLFLDDIYENEATIPLIALQFINRPHLHILLNSIKKYIPDIDADALKQENNMAQAKILHRLFMQNSQLERQIAQAIKNNHELNPAEKQQLVTLVHAYASDNPVYINHYGPAGTITHIPYSSIIKADVKKDRLLQAAVNNKVVFVGRTYQQITKQADSHYTVFTAPDSPGISGVEIMSTVFSNLLDNSNIKTLRYWQSLLLLTGWLLLCYTISKRCHFINAAITLVTISLCYFLFSYYLFTQHFLFIPVAIPVFIFIPLLLLLMIVQYALTNRKKNIDAIHQLQHYLPSYAIEKIEQNTISFKQTQVIHGTCLLTDIKGFTRFSEQYSAEDLHKIMNQYYEILNDQVVQHSGQVVNILGDGLLAIWEDKLNNKNCNIQACKAALSIIKKLDTHCSQLNQALTTCIGLHYGPISIGDLGNDKHIEYAPIGETVNTASKIEAYNRIGQTRILLSDSVHNTQLETHEIGKKILKGKHKAVYLYELLNVVN